VVRFGDDNNYGFAPLNGVVPKQEAHIVDVSEMLWLDGKGPFEEDVYLA
jgi:hypothetical protein